jgi:hypothetical protein
MVHSQLQDGAVHDGKYSTSSWQVAAHICCSDDSSPAAVLTPPSLVHTAHTTPHTLHTAQRRAHEWKGCSHHHPGEKGAARAGPGPAVPYHVANVACQNLTPLPCRCFDTMAQPAGAPPACTPTRQTPAPPT